MSDSLGALRERLRALDSRILELVAEREKLASKIGAEKRRSSRSTRDFQQERDVIERAQKEAETLGLSPELAEQLMLLLIRSALTVQEREGLSVSAGGTGQRALVIGGNGKMGRWFVSFLASQGFEVDIVDPVERSESGHRQYRTIDELPLDHDLIVSAAPLTVTNTIFEEIAKDPPRGVVFDIGSLKSPLRGGLRSLVDAGARVTSVHPMFGPDTKLLSGRHVIFVDVGVHEATEKARELFGSTMAVQVAMDLESHDRLIAYVLGLSHALNIAFFTALAESGEAALSLAKLSSTTFDEQLAVAHKVARDNPELYFEIQSLNDYGTESLSALLYAVERLRSVIRAGDRSAFVNLMEQGKLYLRAREDEH